MKRRLFFSAAILIIAGGALALRLPKLNQRPMHTDEAVQAVKFGALLEKGVYFYDPYEFHGPTLSYFTLVGTYLSSAKNLAQINETTLRMVPVIFGVGLVLLFGLMGDGLGRGAAIWGALLTALSPALVFYSRYYIQETLLVFFTFLLIAAGWRYSRNKNWGWILAAGGAAGLMHATKETCIIAFGALLTALVLITVEQRQRERNLSGPLSAIKGRHLAAGAAVGIVVSVVFYSSFFTNWAGPLDSLRAYATYFDRADGRGIHNHPWYYYLKMLIFTQYGPGPSWSEGLILALAAVGISAGLWGKGIRGANVRLVRFLIYYTVIMTLVYSAIPYKTPWCLLGFLQGMIMLAGVGAAALVRAVPTYAGKAVICGLLAAGVYNLGGQAVRASFKFYADNRNPYVYAHTTTSLVRLAERAEDIRRVHPEGYNMYIQVIAPPDNYWPLPWYLRSFKRVGYYPQAPEEVAGAMIITSIKMQKQVEKKLNGDYQSDIYGLRPGVLLITYIKRQWWDAFMEQNIYAGL